MKTYTKRFELPFKKKYQSYNCIQKRIAVPTSYSDLLIVKPDLERNLGKDEKLTRVSIWTKPAGNEVIVFVHTTREDLRGCR